MKTKSLFIAISLVLTGVTVIAQQKPFTLSGTIKGFTDSYLYLNYEVGSDGTRKMDSSYVKNNRFSFAGELNEPAHAYILADRQGRLRDKIIDIYLSPAKMELTLDYNSFSESVVLKGSGVQDEAEILKKSKAGILAELKPLQAAYDKANMEYINARREGKDEKTLEELKNKATEAQDAMDPYYEQTGKKDVEFMDKYPSSFVTASLLRYKISGMPLAEGEARYAKLTQEVKSSNLGQQIKKELDGLRMGSPGATAYIFSAKELRGDNLSLADYKGKYVLIDFWASWCVPCRKGNPHLLQLYSKYKNKGFEIIGISDDDSNPDAWKKAVEKDGIGVWKHVLRGLKFDGTNFDRTNDISENFGIHTLPTKILIDPDGVIIGRYGGGGENDEAMDKKLAEVFKDKG